MKRNNLYIVPGMIVMVLVFGGLLYFGHSLASRERQVKNELNQMPEVGDATINGLTCYNRPNYLVVARPEVKGADILVKYKIDKDQKFKCEYAALKGDFELLNTPEKDVPEFSYGQEVLFVKDNLLVIGVKIENSQNLIIYNLVKKANIYRDTYNLGSLDLKDSTLTYWRKTTDIPNFENCARVEEYNNQGGAKIEGQISLNLKNIGEKKWSDFKCSVANKIEGNQVQALFY